jgi:hypothetical protein
MWNFNNDNMNSWEKIVQFVGVVPVPNDCTTDVGQVQDILNPNIII